AMATSTMYGQSISLCPTSDGINFCDRLRRLEKASKDELNRIKKKYKRRDVNASERHLLENLPFSLLYIDSLSSNLEKGISERNYSKVISYADSILEYNFIARNGHYSKKNLKETIPEIKRLIKAQDFGYKKKSEKYDALSLCHHQPEKEQLPVYYCKLLSNLLTASQAKLKFLEYKKLADLTEFDRRCKLNLPASIEQLERLQRLIKDGLIANRTQEAAFLCRNIYATNPLAAQGLDKERYLKKIIPDLYQVIATHYKIPETLNGDMTDKELIISKPEEFKSSYFHGWFIASLAGNTLLLISLIILIKRK
ncbi:MAG: hypothetical protein WBA74_19050, partial [Cyclobacteriaceae bacterium]